MAPDDGLAAFVGDDEEVVCSVAKQGELTAARAMYEEVLEAQEAQLGPDHPSTLNTKYNIGMCYGQLAHQAEKKGERAEAAELYTKAGGIVEDVKGSDHQLAVLCRAKAHELST